MGRTKDLCRWAVLLAALVMQALPGGLPAATGGPDAEGYTWTDNRSGCPSTPPTFGPNTLPYLMPTGAIGPLALGFDMPFYGLPVSEAWISPTGYLAFSDQSPEGASQNPHQMPDPTDPNHLVAPLWGQSMSPAVWAESTPDYYHVRWLLADPGGGTGPFDLLLYPDGRIHFFWETSMGGGLQVAVGYEDGTGTRGKTFAWHGIPIEPDFPSPGLGNSVCISPPVYLDCSGAQPVSCNESIQSALPVDPLSEAVLYNCSPDVWHGNEQVFRIDLPGARSATVEIDTAGLGLFQVEGPPDCAETRCLRFDERRLDYELLLPGSYWFVVDKNDPGGGDAFRFSVTCDDSAPPRLECGRSLAGDTAGGTTALDRHACSRRLLDGPEDLYVLTLPVDGTLVVDLDTPEPRLWAVIYDSQGNCLAAGRGGAGISDAPAGDYLVLVDGQEGVDAPYTAGAYCGPPLSPESLDVTLEAGTWAQETKEGLLIPAFPLADVVFALDLTGSMGQELANLQWNAKKIISAISLLVPDLRFGLTSFEDYPHEYRANRNCGYDGVYGADQDEPYRLDLGLTDDIDAFEAAVDAMVLGNGEDFPESYARVMWESVHDPGIGWRPGSRRLLLMFGDDIPHDCAVDACLGGSTTTGLDPGPDEAVGTGDDILLAATLEEMAAPGKEITILHFDSSENAATIDLWNCLAALTGGAAHALNTDGSVPGDLDLVDLVYEAILEEARTCEDLHLVPEVGFEDWLRSVVPQSMADVELPAAVQFAIELGPPGGTANGDYSFTIDLVCDGATVGRQMITIHVAGCSLLARAPGDRGACEGTQLQLQDGGSSTGGCAGDVRYQWSREGVVFRPWDADPTATDMVGPVPTRYTLEVGCFGDAGCDGRSSDSLLVTPLPDNIPPPLDSTLTVEKAGPADIRILWLDLPVAPGGVASYQVVVHDFDAHGSPDPAAFEAAGLAGTADPGVEELTHAGALGTPCETGAGESPCRLIGYKVRATSPCSQTPGPSCNPFPAQVPCP